MLSSLKFLATFRLILFKKNHLKMKILTARTKKKLWIEKMCLLIIIQFVI